MFTKQIRSVLMIGVMVSLILILFVPSIPLPSIPSASATQGGAPAILGFFNEQRKTNAVIDSTLGTGTDLVMDLNVTGEGPLSLNGYDINITFTGTVVSVTGSADQGLGCPFPTCIFGQANLAILVNATTANSIHIAKVVQPPSALVGVGGVVLRVRFHTASTRGASVLHIDSKTVLHNPAAVPYKPIDGYIDNKATASFNYNLGLNMTSRTLIRKVSGTTSAALTASLGLVGTISFDTKIQALGLPLYTTPTFNGTTSTTGGCTPTCSSQTITITINGGAAGSPGTTPSGNYTIVVIGNSTVTGVGQLVKSSWFKLIIKPPPPPVYTYTTTSPTTFTQELGNYTLIPVTATLVSGSPDSIQLDSNCPSKLVGGDCVYNIPSGSSYPFKSNMTVTTNPASTVPGTFMFNATAVTQGTYSEVSVSHFLTFTIHIVKTHDIGIQTTTVSRSFGYNNLILGSHTLQINATVLNEGTVAETFTVNATAKAVAASDSRISFVDANANGVWDPGETIIYDADSSFTYSTGDIVITGTAPTVGTSLSGDFNLRFIDVNLNNHWDRGSATTSKDAVVYDFNQNNLYDASDIIPAGQTGITTPSPGVLLASQSVTVPAGCTPNPPGCTQKVTLSWDPSTLPRGNYRIGTAAVPVPNEFVLGNNFPTPFFSYTQRLKGDVILDCQVNILDLIQISSRFKTPSQYSPFADLNNDGTIDILDLIAVTSSNTSHC